MSPVWHSPNQGNPDGEDIGEGVPRGRSLSQVQREAPRHEHCCPSPCFGLAIVGYHPQIRPDIQWRGAAQCSQCQWCCSRWSPTGEGHQVLGTPRTRCRLIVVGMESGGRLLAPWSPLPLTGMALMVRCPTSPTFCRRRERAGCAQ